MSAEHSGLLALLARTASTERVTHLAFDAPAFRARLRTAKLQAGITWAQLQTRSEISPRALKHFSRREPSEHDGKRGPTLDTVLRLATATGVAPGWLAFGET